MARCVATDSPLEGRVTSELAKPIKDERLRVTLAIFVAKTRLGWSGANCHQQVPDPLDVEHVRHRFLARIARLARSCDPQQAA